MISINDSPVPHLQTPWEWDTFIQNLYIPLKAKNIMEIGSFYGATLWSLMANNPAHESILSLDLPIPPSDGRYDEMVNSRKKWKDWGSTIVEVLGDSHDEKVRTEVFRKVAGTLDLLFIDGDHEYAGVRQDYQDYSPLVRKGGWIVFHDSIGYDSVRKFCSELKSEKEAKFLEINQKNGWGLFCIQK